MSTEKTERKIDEFLKLSSLYFGLHDQVTPNQIANYNIVPSLARTQPGLISTAYTAR
jgi:hypothetical protein